MLKELLASSTGLIETDIALMEAIEKEFDIKFKWSYSLDDYDVEIVRIKDKIITFNPSFYEGNIRITVEKVKQEE